MDAFVENVLTNPAILLGVAAVVFVLCAIWILGRLPSFIVTCVLIAAAWASGYTLLHHGEVQDMLRTKYENWSGHDLPDVPEEEKGKSLSDYSKEAWDSASGYFDNEKTAE